MDCERVGDEGLQADKMDVLYGEADAESRARVEAHLAGCAACREEMAALARRAAGPAARGGCRAARPAFTPRGVVLPRWLAAAALLLRRPRRDAGRRRVRLAPPGARRAGGPRRRARAAAPGGGPGPRGPARAPRRPPRSTPPPSSRASTPASTRGSARARPARSQRLDSRLAGWEERVEAQRRVDMARVAASLSYLDGRHGQQLARTNELMGYVLEASAQKR